VSALRVIQEKVTDLGRTRAFRLAVAVVLSVATAVIAVVFSNEAWRLHGISKRVPDILATADLAARNAVAAFDRARAPGQGARAPASEP
jgi:hypothetical protein